LTRETLKKECWSSTASSKYNHRHQHHHHHHHHHRNHGLSARSFYINAAASADTTGVHAAEPPLRGPCCGAWVARDGRPRSHRPTVT
jgi:hypothetical protein